MDVTARARHISKGITFVVFLIGAVAITGRTFYHPATSGDGAQEQRELVERDAKEKCAVAASKAKAFENRFPKSNKASKKSEPEKSEWEAVQGAHRDCKAVQALLDEPLPMETYERDAQKACGELKKRREAFKRRFPTEESQKDNDVVLNSPEWKAMMEWQQPCDTAQADLEEARKR